MPCFFVIWIFFQKPLFFYKMVNSTLSQRPSYIYIKRLKPVHTSAILYGGLSGVYIWYISSGFFGYLDPLSSLIWILSPPSFIVRKGDQLLWRFPKLLEATGKVFRLHCFRSFSAGNPQLLDPLADMWWHFPPKKCLIEFWWIYDESMKLNNKITDLYSNTTWCLSQPIPQFFGVQLAVEVGG